MKELIIEMLRIALMALVLFPIVGALGCGLINAYFNRLTKYQIDMLNYASRNKKEDTGNA